jgi:hypothetical protein
LRARQQTDGAQALLPLLVRLYLCFPDLSGKRPGETRVREAGLLTNRINSLEAGREFKSSRPVLFLNL